MAGTSCGIDRAVDLHHARSRRRPCPARPCGLRPPLLTSVLVGPWNGPRPSMMPANTTRGPSASLVSKTRSRCGLVGLGGHVPDAGDAGGEEQRPAVEVRVRVHVPEAGQQRAARGVDPLGPGGNRQRYRRDRRRRCVCCANDVPWCRDASSCCFGVEQVGVLDHDGPLRRAPQRSRLLRCDAAHPAASCSIAHRRERVLPAFAHDRVEKSSNVANSSPSSSSQRLAGWNPMPLIEYRPTRREARRRC